MMIAIDLGGTAIKCGLVNGQGEIVERLTVSTPKEQGNHEIVRAIAEAARQLMEKAGLERSQIHGLGLGVPGYLNRMTGVVTRAANIGWENYPVRDILADQTGLPVVVDNDANLAALGEMWKGAGQGAQNMIMVTLGTGVGGGIIIQGKIVSGVNGIGGEIGHITVKPDGVRCGCGKAGCLETESSATAIKRKAEEALSRGRDSLMRARWKEEGAVTPKLVAEMAKQGDKLALEIWDEVAYYLAFALGGLVNSLNPEKIVIGGGVSAAGDLLLAPFQRHFARFALPEAAGACAVELARLGNDAGMIGCAYDGYQRIP